MFCWRCGKCSALWKLHTTNICPSPFISYYLPPPPLLPIPFSPTAPGVPYIATVGTMFVVSSSGAQNTSQQALVYSQELGNHTIPPRGTVSNVCPWITIIHTSVHDLRAQLPLVLASKGLTHFPLPSSQWYSQHYGHLHKWKHHPSQLEASVSS